jgi:RNA polymerase sigma factor (sigma-70 family)
VARPGDGGDPSGGDRTTIAATRAAIAAVFREEAGRLAASVTRVLGDFDAAEEVVQDALVAACERWPVEGVPERPGAWLWTVARRRAVDRLRRHIRLRDKLAGAAWPVQWPAEPADEDDRLRLVFTCCHPALSPEAQVALTLRTVCGLSPAEIASAFLVSESAIIQRLTRARRKITVAGIPYRVPADDELADRLAAVLAVIYLLFNEGYLCSAGETAARRDLTDDAQWLAELLAQLMPAEPEVLGLLALVRLHRARAAARFDRAGRLVLLRDQDRTRWNRPLIADATGLLVRAGRLRQPGPYQLEAAIVACHAEAPSWAETDWLQVLLLYEALLGYRPTPVIRLHRAVAFGQVFGGAAALRETDALASQLSGYHLYHATRAVLLRDLGRTAEARAADEQAIRLTRNPAERALLAARLA